MNAGGRAAGGRRSAARWAMATVLVVATLVLGRAFGTGWDMAMVAALAVMTAVMVVRGPRSAKVLGLSLAAALAGVAVVVALLLVVS